MAKSRATAEGAIAKLARFFKALPQGKLDDIVDDVTDVTDMWSEGDVEEQDRAKDVKMGPKESASGDGAFKMASEYSDPVEGDKNTRAYSEFSRQLNAVSNRVEKTERNLAALLELLSKATGVSLKAEDEEDDETEEEDENEVEKARRMPTTDVKGFLHALSGASRGPNIPPEMARMAKAAPSLVEAAYLDDGLTYEDRTGVELMAGRIAAGIPLKDADNRVSNAARFFVHSYYNR